MEEPQGSKYDHRKKIEPLCNLRRIGIITSLRTSGFPCDLKVHIQTPGSRYDLRIYGKTLGSHTTSRPNHDLKNLRVPSTVSGSNEESMGPHTASGLQS
ncbi:hypothetical protein F2Q68_00004980 [Brassica cretica]|uniref:Uncharacterized protein n=1 Tax=Brassica cretica TaxID=69181 RepID=A0A8S9JPW1_BRACR|nr:hypothetical protein F2Q68_00004980 [Brassica cretica]